MAVLVRTQHAYRLLREGSRMPKLNQYLKQRAAGTGLSRRLSAISSPSNLAAPFCLPSTACARNDEGVVGHQQVVVRKPDFESIMRKLSNQSCTCKNDSCSEWRLSTNSGAE